MAKSKLKKRNPYVLPMVLHCKASKFSKKNMKRKKNKIIQELREQMSDI